MPISERIIPDQDLILVTIEGEVTISELLEWRIGLAGRIDAARYDMIYDVTGYTGPIVDPELNAMMARMSEMPTARRFVLVSLDPMMGPWVKTAFLRNPDAVTSSFHSCSTLAEAAAFLGIEEPLRERLPARKRA